MTVDVAAELAQVHGPWVYAVVVLAALLESAAFVAGTTALVAIGVAIALLGRVVRRRRRADGGGPDRASATGRPVSVS